MIPQALLNRPTPSEYLLWVLEAFNFLGRFRIWREGIPDPIKFSDATTYAKLSHLNTSDQVFEFCQLITVCDTEYISYHIKEANRKLELAKKNGKK